MDKVGKDLCQNLPAAHALTGCDTSSLFKIGKHTAYTKLVEHVKSTPNALKMLVLSGCIPNDVTAARAYILAVYA